MASDMDRAILRPWYRKRWTAISVGLAVAVALVALALFLIPARRSVRVPIGTVTIDSVTRGVFHDFTTLQGRVVPRDMVYLDALEGGQVQKVLVHAGDRVTAGQPLIIFRNTQLELDVMEREGRLVESITQLQSFEKQLEQNRAENAKTLAQIDYNVERLRRMAERRDPLSGDGYVSREQAEQVREELAYNRVLQPLQTATNQRQEALRKRQLPGIQTEMASLQQSLGLTRAKLGDLIVRAPVTGRLTTMDLQPGQNRNHGDRLGMITQDTGFKIAASVDEYYLGRVFAGQLGEVEIADRTARLVAERIYPEVQNGVFTVDLQFRGAAPAGLLPGQAVQGKLALGADRPGLTLPAGAFLERSGGDFVFVVSPNGRHAERRRVKLGRRNSEQIEVLRGLAAGERVITSDYQGFEKIDRIDLEN
jgi:HlyD family secretion protein